MSRERTTMTILAIVIGFVGLGWLVFNLAVYAAPVLAGVTAGLFSYRTGAGPVGAVAIAAGAGVVTLVVGQFIFAIMRSSLLKNLVAAAFTLPAALVGYHLVLGLSTLGTPSATWQHLFAVIGAAVVGATAWARFVSHPFETPVGHTVGAAPPHSSSRAGDH
jgi:hypothetical protein